MISSIMGNSSIFRVAVEEKSHLWLSESSLYREPSWWFVPLVHAASPRGRTPSNLLTHLLHLCPSGYGTAECQELR